MSSDESPRGEPGEAERAQNACMGLFTQRPEEPSEWAGLPGEPVRPRSRAEELPDDTAPEASPVSLLGLVDAPVTSVRIPVQTAEPQGSAD